jgi:hypothetical protein
MVLPTRRIELLLLFGLPNYSLVCVKAVMSEQ